MNYSGKTGRSRWLAYLAAMCTVALGSLAISLVADHLVPGNIPMLYLVVVLVAARAFGSGPAVCAAAAAFLGLDWWFVGPPSTLIAGSPSDELVLAVFLLAALLTGQLAASLQIRSREVREHQHKAALLYEIGRLISEADVEQALGVVSERLRLELDLAMVIIEVSDGDFVSSRGQSPEGESSAEVSATPPWQTLAIRARDRQVGELLLFAKPGRAGFTESEDHLLSAIVTQLGMRVERVRMKRELAHSEIASRADELKTALLRAVSHDLRTPLSSIIASAGSLLQDDVCWTASDRRQFTEAIRDEAARLNRIVENLLDLSRIDSGSLQPQKSWYTVPSLVDDVLGRMRHLTARHVVAVDIPEDLPPVLVDCVEIDQVLSNLIENATKYAPPATELLISARLHRSEIRVSVSDRGPGVPPAALPHLFEPFYSLQGDQRRARSTGLGLAVAKGLIDAHDGRIWAENRAGGGACFTFTLAPTAPNHVTAISCEVKK